MILKKNFDLCSVGRRGRPPLSVKKEKLTRSKSINDDQSTNDSFATSSIADESRIDDKKSAANVSSDSEAMDRSDDKDIKNEDSVEQKSVQPPELHDENTVENRMTEEDSIPIDSSPLSIKVEQTVEQMPTKSVVSASDQSLSQQNDIKQESDNKKESQTTPVKDAFDFDDEEVLKEEEPLKEQLKKKRKSKDDGKKSKNEKSITSNNKTETATKEVSNEDNIVKDIGRSNSFSRKSTKKSRKAVPEVVEKPVVSEAAAPAAEELPPPLPKELPIEAKEEEKAIKTMSSTKAKNLSLNVESPPLLPKQTSETKQKRKGRKRKDDESVSPVKKKTKPSKLDLHEDDSNLEVQKLFESYSSSTPPQESDVSPVEEMKVLPQFTADINPPQQESLSSDFLMCEEAVPASPEKACHPDDCHLDDSMPAQESPHSGYHSSPTQSPKEADKDPKGSGGSNSELENEPIVSTKDESNSKMEGFPSPAHDEDSMISRPDCNKSPISPKKRRRGRVRTTSQSDSYPKERIGCKTRGSSGNYPKNKLFL